MNNMLPKGGEKLSSPLTTHAESTSWFSALKHSSRAALRFDRSQLTPVQAIRSIIKESRLARSNAEASLQHSLQEPSSLRMNSDVARGLFGAMDIVVRSALVLEAYLIDNPSRHALPAIAAFAQQVDEALRVLATAIGEGQNAVGPPDLREALHTLENAAKQWKHMPAEARIDLPIVRAEAKHIIRTLDTMYHLLSIKGQQE